jgi:hypothetical protein
MPSIPEKLKRKRKQNVPPEATDDSINATVFEPIPKTIPEYFGRE